MKTLRDLQVSGKRVFLRADIDVPFENGVVQDTQRLQDLLPTINYLLSQKSSVLIAGHIDRPEGKDPNLSARNLINAFSSLLNIAPVFFDEIESVDMTSCTLGLLENLRFWPEEEANDENFSKKLSSLADVYVNEDFAASHRAHASIAGVPKFLPHGAGFRLKKEVEELSRVLQNPRHPLVVIIGGAKIETKLPVIDNLAKIADHVLVGGKLPSELAGKELKDNVSVAQLNPEGKDISDTSILEFREKLSTAEMIVWNGPMGLFEEREFEKGTREIAGVVAQSSAEKIVGGGETIWALKKFGVLEGMDWVSSGGGAMLEFLSGKPLPGILALE